MITGPALIVATTTGEPLVIDVPVFVTTAVNGPLVVGCVVNVTTKSVAVDPAPAVPTAPSLKTTALLAGVVLKPLPAIITIGESAPRVPALKVTIGPAEPLTTATSTGDPLDPPKLVTTAVSDPADGAVSNCQVIEVVVAEIA